MKGAPGFLPPVVKALLGGNGGNAQFGGGAGGAPCIRTGILLLFATALPDRALGGPISE